MTVQTLCQSGRETESHDVGIFHWWNDKHELTQTHQNILVSKTWYQQPTFSEDGQKPDGSHKTVDQWTKTNKPPLNKEVVTFCVLNAQVLSKRTDDGNFCLCMGRWRELVIIYYGGQIRPDSSHMGSDWACWQKGQSSWVSLDWGDCCDWSRRYHELWWGGSRDGHGW